MTTRVDEGSVPRTARSAAFLAAHPFVDLATGGGLARRGLLSLLLTEFDHVDVIHVLDGAVERTRITTERMDRSTIAVIRFARARRMASVIGALLRHRPLNAALLDSIPNQSISEPYDLVVIDTVREWKNRDSVTADATILALDDLLSLRYEAATTLDEPELVLHSARPVPPLLARPVRAVVRRLLAREGRLLRDYELDAVDGADIALLVATHEAEVLRGRGCASRVHATGIPAGEESQDVTPEVGPTRAVLLGDFRYYDNIVSLGQVHDALLRDPHTDPVITVIGVVPDWVRRRHAHPRLSYAGFVPSLQDAIALGTVSIVAGANPGGLKTKAIESMMLGSALWALDGRLDQAHFPTVGAGIRTFRSVGEIVAALAPGQLDPSIVIRDGRCAHRFAMSHFSTDAFVRANRQMLTGLSR